MSAIRQKLSDGRATVDNFLSSTINCPYGSLARSVPKPLKVPSLARSMPKPLLIELSEAGGHQPGRYEPLLIFAADLLPSWLSVANAVRLPQVNRRQRGTRYDSPKSIVSEVKSESEKSESEKKVKRVKVKKVKVKKK